MGKGPWVQPPDQTLPVDAALTAGVEQRLFSGDTFPGGWVGLYNPMMLSWSQVRSGAAGSVEGVIPASTLAWFGRAGLTRATSGGLTGDGPPWYELHRGIGWVTASPASYPQVGPDTAPDGATVEFEGDGQYVSDATVVVSCETIAEVQETWVSGILSSFAITGSVRRVASLDGADPGSIGVGSFPDVGTLLGGSLIAQASVISDGSDVASGECVLPLGQPSAFTVSSAWEGGGPPALFEYPAPESGDRAVTAYQTIVEFAVVEASAVYRPPRYRVVTPGGGQWRLRQRQSLSGADGWPLRQRQAGGHGGSWPLRQRQGGV